MYICNECGLVFNNPKQYSEDRTPYGGSSEPGFTEHYKGCPSCGGNYDEAMQCVRCDNEYISVESDCPFCEGCQLDLDTVLAEVITDNFREDEYDYICASLECMSYKDLLNKKGE